AGQPHRDRRLQRPAGRRQVHPDALDGAGHRQVRGLRLDRPPLRRPRRRGAAEGLHRAAGDGRSPAARPRRRHHPRQGRRLPRGPREVALHEGRRGGVGASPREADREPPRTDGGERTMNRTTPTQDLRSGAMSADLAAAAPERLLGLTAGRARYTDPRRCRDARPERCYQTGMAGQALLRAATGLGMEGYAPFAAPYSVFATRRAYDSLLLDNAEANLN